MTETPQQPCAGEGQVIPLRGDRERMGWPGTALGSVFYIPAVWLWAETDTAPCTSFPCSFLVLVPVSGPMRAVGSLLRGSCVVGSEHASSQL